ncbi:hypothetical protein [Streptomyces antimicrobicus]|uniref:Uncharacterized protein n=1 Tax=Streptomyces antimicrobicus TaxID=2883108 RepID=A0ABS8BBA1_9ACTN|nr:hypothetical protein [Streptomyces antimicrobicus]MCB5181889.1 hypothetical protein [Streptomyces antimicrobicus]
MSTNTSVSRRDRARAFVPELIPDPVDLVRSGPLDVREQRDLERIHAARDNHQNARWMRGKALEAAFRRQLYRGEDGQRTRQQYLDDEWDGISESAAYLEIKEWRLAEKIADTCQRPAPDSHVRALVDVAAAHGHEAVARWYGELRRCGAETGRRVTAEVVSNLAEYLSSGRQPELDSLFVPRQLPPAQGRTPSSPARRAGRIAGEPVTGRVVSSGSFQNFGMSRGGSTEPEQEWTLGAEHVAQLSTWLVAEARRTGTSPDLAADLLVNAVSNGPLGDWLRARVENAAAALATTTQE